jgi:pimeloyl-ACP methyl ester carboxylesterase
MSTTATVTYPGARRPDRKRRVDAHGVGIAVSEWGDVDAPPLLLAHGGFDFAGTFDVFAPMLADGGWRVVSWDQRGHGDSDHVHLYNWSADTRDALAVLDSTTHEPVPVIGHSKGGGLMLQLAEACPHRVTHYVSIDGLPTPHPHPDVADHDRTRLLADELTDWLAHRRRIATLERKPGTLDELATRRGRMNPRLPIEWLRYLVTIAGREDADGWRWKIDPALRFGGFGPHRPQWTLSRLPNLSPPMLGFMGLQPEPMGWGARPSDIEPYMPAGGRLEVFDDVGHFVHIERPRDVADLVLEFLK